MMQVIYNAKFTKVTHKHSIYIWMNCCLAQVKLLNSSICKLNLAATDALPSDSSRSWSNKLFMSFTGRDLAQGIFLSFLSLSLSFYMNPEGVNFTNFTKFFSPLSFLSGPKVNPRSINTTFRWLICNMNIYILSLSLSLSSYRILPLCFCFIVHDNG